MLRHQQKSGFTVLELLIVIAVIAILAAVLLPNLVQARNRAHDRNTQSFVYQVVVGVEANRTAPFFNLPSQNPCTFFAGLSNNPASVSQCLYEPDPVAQTYEVFAESITGQVYHFNGLAIIQTASFP